MSCDALCIGLCLSAFSPKDVRSLSVNRYLFRWFFVYELIGIVFTSVKEFACGVVVICFWGEGE